MGVTVSIEPHPIVRAAREGGLVVDAAGFVHWRGPMGGAAGAPCVPYVGMLFRPEMAKAVHAGTKTQTRRAITARNAKRDGHPTRSLVGADWSSARVDPGPSPAGNPGPYLHVPFVDVDAAGTVSRLYSRVRPGDILWSRETWRPADDDDARTEFFSTMSEAAREAKKWRSPLHLPQKRARLFLVVADVTPQRLEEIDDADALAEGVTPCKGQTPLAAFVDLWHRVHGPGAWERMKSAWVWRYRFVTVRST